MSFEPVAIVGRGCVLPGALDPDSFGENVLAGRMNLGPVPDGRWGVSHRAVIGDSADRTWTDVGGYVRDFDAAFDPSGFAIDPGTIGDLDRVFQWTLYGAREALRESGQEGCSARTGLVLGNLSYPSAAAARYAEAVWWGESRRPDARNRFCSGLPAHLVARALGLGAGAFALDAACASALYAIKIACDRLHDRRAELMIAGGVNASDNLNIHMGFSALGALSRTGSSRPFHRDADGLVPAEGAAFVALMRLSDAITAGAPIHGVIRGIGLANDGRAASLLSPAQQGQTLAMRLAYETAGLSPQSVSLAECHATGTVVGDAMELRSMLEVFGGCADLPIGSVKSNVGHLITAAGGASLLKVLGAMKAGLRPPTLNAQEPLEGLAGTPFRLLHQAEEWQGPQRAAVSAFGFGGNNAHLIVDSWDPDATRTVIPIRRTPQEIAIVAVGVRTGDADFRSALFQGGSPCEPMREVEVALDGLRVPPSDLEDALAQQVLMLETVRDALPGLSLPAQRTMVLVGAGCDPEQARYLARWRLPDRVEHMDPAQVPALQSAFAPALNASAVVGSMLNIVANRINAQFDLGGPSYTVSAEEASGLVAIGLAARALKAGEADAAVVGAVDLSAEPVHRAALRELGLDRVASDAAVVLVLKRRADARRDGDRVIALLGEDSMTVPDLVVGDRHLGAHYDPADQFGSAHAVQGLLSLAVAALALHHRALPGQGTQDLRAAEAVVAPLEAAPIRVRLRAADAATPTVHAYSGGNQDEVLGALDTGHESAEGPARLVVLSSETEPVTTRLAAARQWLAGGGVRPEGVAFRAEPVTGELGFVYTNGSAAYPDMGRELVRDFPAVAEAVEECFGPLLVPRSDVLDQIRGAGALAALHTELTRGLFGLNPTAAIGYSSGESASLLALGAWRDPVQFGADARNCGLFTQELGGELRAIRRIWKSLGIKGERWASYLVGVPAEQLRLVPAVHLLAINAPDACVIGGEETACASVVAGLPSVRIDYELVAHLRELADVRDRHWKLHHRVTHPVPGVRFYTGATSASYSPTAELAADALTGQALRTIDFVKMIEQAWADGVRVFVEHGPRGLCTGWIQRILAGRDHIAVALDAPGRGTRQLFRAIAELMAAGIPVDTDALFSEKPLSHGAVVRLAAHRPPVILPKPVRRDPVLPAAVQHQGRIHELHRTFLAKQAEFQALQAQVHTRFRESRLRAETALPAVPARPETVFDRGQLERLASGRISEVFGPEFVAQDGYLQQTRLPTPPLLLVDRVTDIDAVPASMGTGTIWTETDVRLDSWYLDGTGLMPPGLLVESGQADMLLISWLGVDLLNQGERRYRLLGCDLRFHGSPPGPGDTVRHQISVDRHAEHDGVRLFFFHSECRIDGSLRLTVSNGQAGFFTDQELAESTGVLWDPAAAPLPSGLRLDSPLISGVGRSFDHEAVRAFATGRPADCYGPAWTATRAHVRSPRIDDGRMLLLGEVTELDPEGGPWGRGYLRAELPITPDDWFFDGHFLNDPCMPGTLMAQGSLQAMAFYLAALGFTIERDGWRFEPVPDEMFRMRCRSQVTPASRRLIYEVFISELHAGPCPTLFADVLCSADGIAALHSARLGLRLVPDWPLNHWRALSAPAVQKTGDLVPPARLGGLLAHRETAPVAEFGGVRYDYAALLASAWGRPSEAYGSRFAAFDGSRRTARLPGPPYQFTTRVTSLEAPPSGDPAGSRIEIEYDVPDEVWYFEQNGQQVMPFCVLNEVVLQPCGALAVAVGSTLDSAADVFFRNLGGDITVVAEVGPGTRTIRTRVELRSHTAYDGMIIQVFGIECFADGQPVLSGSATFGFFPSAAFLHQGGLPATPAEQSMFAEPCDYLVELSERPAKYCGGQLRLAGPMLLMLDRVTGYWPEGGAAGLGRLRAEKDVDADEWFFKAHFFQDPVQPGSLGLESMCQLLQFYMIDRNLGRGIRHPRFEPIMTGAPLSWKYRGQVVPGDGRVTVEVEITEIGEDGHGPYVTAEAWLWVDGRRIYQARRIGMRIISGSEGDVSPALAGQVLVTGRGISTDEGDETVLSVAELEVSSQDGTVRVRGTSPERGQPSGT
ncbi:beta-ketoacyl synthase N-terminal-like domain-containing protein [Actinomadura alba]|uniref:Beta keto-acyl synthase n=1 Tax=Actinomadura alba TaxID=406431 RepID=A0ABR7LJN2_9ACTN|nr:beta-ketoacyl synthase N-terminal-like domain-containing protein [Actinomadura alba]MBC6465064.1 beta keto-acyl synthase [Actinomadura alba]